MAKRVTRQLRTEVITIDGDPVSISIKAFSPEETREFRRAWRNSSVFPSETMISTRMPDEMEKRSVARELTDREALLVVAMQALDEQGIDIAALPEQVRDAIAAARLMIPEQPEDEEFVIPASTIRMRRLGELTPKQREEYDRIDAEEEARAAKFAVDTITNYIRVNPGQLFDVDSETDTETEIVTGAQLVQMYANRIDVQQLLIRAVWQKNFLTVKEKNDSRPPSGSVDTLRASNPDHGSEPATTAQNAEQKGSAEIVDATASHEHE